MAGQGSSIRQLQIALGGCLEGFSSTQKTMAWALSLARTSPLASGRVEVLNCASRADPTIVAQEIVVEVYRVVDFV